MPRLHRRLLGFERAAALGLAAFQGIDAIGLALRLLEILDRLAVLGDQRLAPRRRSASDFDRKVPFEEGAEVLRAHRAVVDQFGQRVHLAVEIDQHVGPLAGRQHVAEFLQRPDEGPRAVAAAPGVRHLPDPLFLGEAGRVLLVLLIEREAFLLAALAAGIRDHAVGKGEAVLARELPRHHHQLLAVEGLVDGLAVLGVDARPDDVAVLAPVLDMKDDRARLAGEAELAFGAVDIVEILRPGQLALAPDRD